MPHSMKARPPLPQSPAEWQSVVDQATALLHLDSARQYGLVTGGPNVNVDRCCELLREAERRGIVPSPTAVEDFVAGWNQQVAAETH